MISHTCIDNPSQKRMMLPKRGLLVAAILIGASLGDEVSALFAQSNQYERMTTCGTLVGIILGLIVGAYLDVAANQTEQQKGKPLRLAGSCVKTPNMYTDIELSQLGRP